MPRHQIRFVTACQQLLALGLVLAFLTPAAGVLSLDVVHDRPSTTTAASDPLAARMSAYIAESNRSSTVPTQVVDPTVKQVGLTAASGAGSRARAALRANLQTAKAAKPAKATKPTKGTKGSVVAAEQAAHASQYAAVTSVPEPVVGYGAVGVTWEHGAKVSERDITLKVRTRTGATWSRWMDLEYDADHGPDPGTAEARRSRPGTDALLVGDVDDVQVTATSGSGALPADLKLSVIDPGQARRTAVERPALDTDPTAPSTPTDMSADPGTTDPGTTDPGTTDPGTTDPAGLDLQAAAYTPRPQIYSRAQWGADERMRQKSSLHYFEVHAGFVHHTVNANNYTRAQVPGIIRSIYAYHTKSRGWSDIGYNFLIDRFGRIWEGRYGGVDRPVVGAHTEGYNDNSFAASAIGNYDIAQPSSAMVQAYGALFAWKLSLHGVDAQSPQQWVTKRYFKAINGHRDAKSTACPGKYLYAQIPRIRQLAEAAQRGWAGRNLESNLASTANPDIVVRRASDGRIYILPTGGLEDFAPRVMRATGLGSSATVVSPDITGDGIADLLVVSAAGAQIRPGTAAGGFGPLRARVMRGFAGHTLLTAVGDLNGDHYNDLVGRRASDGKLAIFLGRRGGLFSVHYRGSVAAFNMFVGPGDITGDGKPDLVVRDTKGVLWVYPGDGAGGITARRQISAGWSGFSSVVGMGDLTGDGRADLLARNKTTGYSYIYAGHGDGTFSPARGPITSTAGAGVLMGATQFVDNAMPDAFFRSGSTVTVMANRGTTSTRPFINTGLVLPKITALLNAGDWDRDGHGDIITREANGDLMLRRGDGRGHFAAPIRIGIKSSTTGLLAAVGDMTGDGWPDLMGQPKGGAMRIYPGRGVAGLAPSYVAHSAIKAGRQVAVGRWNTDGAPDSILINGASPVLYPGNGPGGLTSAQKLSLNLAPYDWVIGISDIGITGHPDLVVRERATGRLWLLPGTTAGFGTRRLLAEGMGGFNLAG